jgi:hypothetical protein
MGLSQLISLSTSDMFEEHRVSSPSHKDLLSRGRVGNKFLEDDRSLINLKRWLRGQKVGPEIVRYQLGISCPNLMARPIS